MIGPLVVECCRFLLSTGKCCYPCCWVR